MNPESALSEGGQVEGGSAETERLQAPVGTRASSPSESTLDQPLAQFGIVNRETARARGLRNTQRPRSLAVPKAAKRKRRRR